MEWVRQRPKWSLPLWDTNARYRGAKGGRSSGKSHEFGAAVVERMFIDPSYSVVCIREIQKSLRFSAKRLIEAKIQQYGLGEFFEVQAGLIKRINGSGVCIFQGMQDHTADSIKSLEDFDLAWCEEAQSLSQRSLDLLTPTIRKPNSEIWFSWNPDLETDPVDMFFSSEPDNSVCVHVNYMNNPFCPENVIEQAEDWRRRRPDTYDHVWLGGYNTKSEDQVLNGVWRVDEFEPQPDWDGPYFGADWGFSTDPSTLISCYIDTSAEPATLYVRHERYGHGIEINDYPEFFSAMPAINGPVIRADNARPEIISYLQKHGYPMIIAADKWAGSVEDGISTLRGFAEIVIHPDCEHTIDEARLWKYKRDRLTGDILPKLIDGNDHCVIGSTLIDTDRGQVPIADLVGKTGKVQTSIGLRDFNRCRMTSKSEHVYRVKMESGREFTGTAEHMMLTFDGYKPILSLKKGDEICSTMESSSTYQKTDTTRKLSEALASICTGMFGKSISEKSRRAITYTTRMASRLITELKTLSVYPQKNTAVSIGKKRRKLSDRDTGTGLLLPQKKQRIGTRARLAENGTANTQQKFWQIGNMTLSAGTAEMNLNKSEASERLIFAQMLASLLTEENQVSITSQGNALVVAQNFQQTNTKSSGIAQSSAAMGRDKVASIEYAGMQPVYNLETPGVHDYCIEGGLVSHNCWDAIRYALAPFVKGGDNMAALLGLALGRK